MPAYGDAVTMIYFNIWIRYGRKTSSPDGLRKAPNLKPDMAMAGQPAVNQIKPESALLAAGAWQGYLPEIRLRKKGGGEEGNARLYIEVKRISGNISPGKFALNGVSVGFKEGEVHRWQAKTALEN